MGSGRADLSELRPVLRVSMLFFSLSRQVRTSSSVPFRLSLFLFPPRPSTDGRQRAAASVVSSPALGKDRLVLVTLGSEDDDEELENASSSSSDSSSGGLSATSPLVRGSSDSSGGKRRRKKKRPLVILFGWLGARAKDLDKYAEAWQVRKREREREN